MNREGNPNKSSPKLSLGKNLNFINILDFPKKMNTREILIDILSKEWPLSAKKIHSILKKNYRKSITYHTMYEILQDLVKKQIVLKSKTTYLLSERWIKIQLQRFQKINKSYEEIKPMKIIDKKTTQVEVHSIQELHKFILKNIEGQFFAKDPKTFFMKCQHLWGGFYTEEEKGVLKKTFRNGAWIIAKSKTLLDQKIAKFYKLLGANVKLNVMVGELDTIIIGDCIIQIYFPEELLERMNKIYSGKLTLFNMRKIKKTYEENHCIQIIITRNERLAKRLKKEIKKHLP